MVCRDKLAAAQGDHIKGGSARQLCQPRESRDARDHVIPSRSGPSLCEIPVIDEYVGRVWRGSAVLEVLESAVEQQRGAACIEKHRRKCVVVAIDNQRTWGVVTQCFGQRTRREIR